MRLVHRLLFKRVVFNILFEYVIDIVHIQMLIVAIVGQPKKHTYTISDIYYTNIK